MTDKDKQQAQFTGKENIMREEYSDPDFESWRS